MITVKLLGGLGNQMFQRAFGMELESRGYAVGFDRSGLIEGTHREYSLGIFGNPRLYTLDGPCLTEDGPRFQPHLVTPLDPAIMNGYWQSEKYFASVRTQVWKHFTKGLMNLSLSHDNYRVSRDIMRSKSTFLHVRRQDYVDLQHFHGMPSIDYYMTAVDRIRSKQDTKVFVFSDDRQWCRDNFPKDFVIVDGTNKYEDLYLMSFCEYAVIANSSFSWWGAWLGDSIEKKRVIAPKRWFAASEMDDQDIVPERWERL